MLGFSPWPQLRIEPGLFKVWKQQAGDAVYYPGMGVAASAQQSRGRDVGNILRANLKWFASKNLTFDLDYKYYDVGGALRSAGADNSQFVSCGAPTASEPEAFSAPPLFFRMAPPSSLVAAAVHRSCVDSRHGHPGDEPQRGARPGGRGCLSFYLESFG